MNSSLTEQPTSRLLTWSRLGAFGCFLIAAGILMASLLAPTGPSGTVGLAPTETGALR